MKVDARKIKRICESVLAEKDTTNIVSGIEVKVADKFPAVAWACINMQSNRAYFIFRTDFYKQLRRLKSKYNLKQSVKEIRNDILYALPTHELDHPRRCPGSKKNQEEITAGIEEAVEKIESNPAAISGKTHAIANMFEDTVLNTINAHYDDNAEKYKRGMLLHYLVDFEGRKRRFFEPGTTSFNLFLESNLLLWNGDQYLTWATKKYIPRFHRGYTRKLNKIIEIMMDEDKKLISKVIGRKIDPITGSEIATEMAYIPKWREKAKEYARIIAPLIVWDLDPKDLEDMLEQEAPSSGEQKQDQIPAGGKKKDKKKSAATIRAVGKTFEELDEYYRSQAKKLRIESEAEGLAYPTYVGYEEVPLSEIDPTKIDWAETRLARFNDGRLHLELYQKAFPIILSMIKHKVQKGCMPDFDFILDRSPSMWWILDNPKSPYHLGLVGFYTILDYIESNSLQYLLNYHMTTFSDTTDSSGWCRYDNINDIKRTAFDHKGMDTILYIEHLEKKHRTRQDDYVSVMLTDGYISNYERVVDTINQTLDNGCVKFLLFILGEENSFSKAMREIGADVRIIGKPEDFANQSVRIAEGEWGET